MSNQMQLGILKQGVQAWNLWRNKNLEAAIDLSRANLQGLSLNSIDLSMADLREADLSGADLTASDLIGTNLRGADLWLVNLSAANLKGANLTEANLRWANFNLASLTETDFSQSVMGATIFANVDLSTAKGLDRVRHDATSSISLDTVYGSQGKIPEAFLRAAGVPENFVLYMRSLVTQALEFYSCFISYSNKDHAFAERLYADLQSKNVRCWFAPEDLKIGDKFPARIREAIRMYDKLLLVASENSIRSLWVEREVEAALEKELRYPGSKVLFLVRLDEAIMETDFAWAVRLRRQWHIGDFRDWKNHDKYQKAFERLLRDLKAKGDASGQSS